MTYGTNCAKEYIFKSVSCPRVSCNFCNIPTGGYYTEKLLNLTGYRLLILNTNLYYDQNKLNLDLDDPAGQFSWADQVLTEAANKKEKAKNLVHLFFATGVKYDLKMRDIFTLDTQNIHCIMSLEE